MKRRAFFLLFLLGACGPSASTIEATSGMPRSAEVREASTPLVVIRPQTEEEAFVYLMEELREMPFFRQHGYDVALPKHPLFEALAAPDARPEQADEAALRRAFASEVYRESDFAAGLRALGNPRPMLAQVFQAFHELNESWGFKVFPRYEVLVTLYGPGGSYDSERGRITLFTTSEGRFKRSSGIEVVIHEMVHIGIETRIVRPFGLTHLEKERLVDRICATRFRKLLPSYVVQGKKDDPLDAFVTEDTLDHLPDAVEKYVRSKPRE